MLRLALLSALRLAASSEPSCEAAGAASCESPHAAAASSASATTLPRQAQGQGHEAGLLALQLASDNRRWQVSQVLPDRRLGDLQLADEYLAEGVLSAFRRTDEEQLLVLRTLKGGTRSFLGPRWRELGPVEEGGPAVSSLSAARDGRLLALGHRGGLVTLRAFEGGAWLEVARAKVSHHEWETVTLTALSDDGGLLLAASEDNVMLFRLEADEVTEVKHLHGGATQISAACIAELSEKRHLAVVAYQRGGLEGWTVDGRTLQVAWKIPGERPMARLDAALAADLPSMLLAAAGTDGSVTVWSLTASGALASPAAGRWSSGPRSGAASCLRLLRIKPALVGILRYGKEAPQWLLATGFQKEVVVLDPLTGSELQRFKGRQPVAACQWR
ncbi:unnamed protein product [Effrenium voratum]|uniref:Uncharacterized protein n=1 Tax=Effrenium voratum TaxID=2562239 RepID=A0AA36MXM7_9DINO|nr:unnamed protein product [Effrenium voratum]CAJ1435274.1 unnamed protein product [Effrenium voratum]